MSSNTVTPKKGDKVEFWQTIKGNRIRRIGIFNGYKYNGTYCEVITGYGIDAYHHNVHKKNVKVLTDDKQSDLPF